MRGEEWHAYDRRTRRMGVVFQVPEEHFPFQDHADVLDIQMIDARSGFLLLRTRRRRSFFASVLPSAERFLTLHRRRLPRAASPPAWCAGPKIRELVHK